ncbi:35670_t:CDS:2, partial [Racocetra persica]
SLNIPFTFPYLEDKIMGPVYQIISCNQSEPFNSWNIQLFLSKRINDFLILWTVYLYQYRKELCLTWLNERKERLKLQNEISSEESKDSIRNNILNK